MPRMNSIIELISKLESANISVKQDRCISVRNRNASCFRCAEACTSGCISYRDNELDIAPLKCVGCGTCATACPTGAIEAKRPTDLDLEEQCRKASANSGNVAVIACERILNAANGLYDPAKVTSVTCLGRVDESLVMSLVANGVEGVILTCGACEECELRNGRNTALAVCETCETLLEAWGTSAKIKLSDKLPSRIKLTGKPEYDSGRRAFFASAKSGAETAAAITADHVVANVAGEALGVEAKQAIAPKYAKVQSDGTLPHCVPSRRERLIDALDALGEPEDIMISTRLWGEVEIDMDKCRSCRMCATFCPTGSIFKFHTAKGRVGVKHRMHQCVKCRCCEMICPEGAISISDEVFAQDITERRVERFVMPPIDAPANSSKSIIHSMRKLIECEQLFER